MYHIKYKYRSPYLRTSSGGGIEEGFTKEEGELYSDCSILEIERFIKETEGFSYIESINHVVGEILKSPKGERE